MNNKIKKIIVKVIACGVLVGLGIGGYFSIKSIRKIDPPVGVIAHIDPPVGRHMKVAKIDPPVGVHRIDPLVG